MGHQMSWVGEVWLKGPYTRAPASELVQSLGLGHPEPRFNPSSASSSCVTLDKSLPLSASLSPL